MARRAADFFGLELMSKMINQRWPKMSEEIILEYYSSIATGNCRECRKNNVFRRQDQRLDKAKEHLISGHQAEVMKSSATGYDWKITYRVALKEQ